MGEKSVTLESRILLAGPLVWDPNRELKGPDAEIQEQEKKFNRVFEQYIGQIVLVQGFNNSSQNLILVHGEINSAKKRHMDEGGHFFLGFNEDHSTAVSGDSWEHHLRVYDFVGGGIVRVVGSKMEVIYEDAIRINRWNELYKKWEHRGGNLTPSQLIDFAFQKFLSRSLLRVYGVYPK